MRYHQAMLAQASAEWREVLQRLNARLQHIEQKQREVSAHIERLTALLSQALKRQTTPTR